MTLKTPRIRALFLIAAASVFLAVNFGTSAQSEKRRRVAAAPTPKPTASAKPAPAPQPTSIPVPSPTPAAPVQTLTELQAKIRTTLLRPELRRGSVGVKIVTLNTGRVVFEEKADQYFMPASNMKNFTVATAMEKLSPDFRFVTSVFAAAKPDAGGTLRGGLSVYGRGDVSISTAFNEGDYYRGIENLADKIVQAGVKRIEGDLVGDESYFSGGPIPATWEWDDLQWYWGAEISAFPINDNAVDLSVGPGSPNTPCIVQVLPINVVVKVVNTCVTMGSARDLKVEKKLGQNIFEISGSMPAGDPVYKNSIAVSHPAELFMALLRQVLERKGVPITGQIRVIGAKEKAIMAFASSVPPVEIARLESPPFSVVAAKTMKPSQNMYTETILWTLGEQVGDKSNPKLTSAERGIAVVRSFLRRIGIPDGSILQHDGSGLSRHNLITPSAVTALYTYMAKSRYASAWRDSLTIGGVDGTLRNRFKGTAAAGNMRGKTGTIDQVSALSGYVSTAAGEPLVISIIVNGVEGSPTRQAIADEIVINLANFNGRID
jgi:D-alanyl-D-alanine carboxypeptidase/D-alanyl-D-alanine-endopeptidase (penicillin-binding protein 4)